MTRRSPPPALAPPSLAALLLSPPPPLSASLPLLLLLSLLLQAPAASAAPAPGLMRACGSQLADLLAWVCRGTGYNDPLAVASAAMGAGAGTAPDAGPHAKTSGVADDCCRRRCNYSTLQQYCSPADPRRSSGPGSARTAAAPSTSVAANAAAAAASVGRDAGGAGRELPVRALLEKRAGSRSTTAAPSTPPASFRVGVVRSYFNHFVLPPALASAGTTAATTTGTTAATTAAATAATAG